MRSASALLLIVVASGTTACAAVPDAPRVHRADGTILLAASNPPDAAMDAIVAGTLTRTENGCLALDDLDGLHVLEFPYGTTLADDGETVEVPGLGPLRIGDAVEGGGGYLDVADAPDECRTGNDFAIWQTVLE
ncbi:hypothetical protein [Agromyces marinus]|uniref:Uncharacterized protein n=1 Tax=Agromyces marinus TaxID=1389020 RepID=A0ABM8H2Y0_9MICO|nr:hypothetical protein [Agromyces marinus]UIP59769.1 hypothetical protein DSM26151_26830 [Agromyces marinus]BDZ55148.1 hypothetical protein GCM10025870_22210 [Agromyces marinus]